MRLIDADALKNAMFHEAFETDTPLQKWDSGCWIRYKLFEQCINNAITIEEVVVDLKDIKLKLASSYGNTDTVQITKLIRCKDCVNWDTSWRTRSGAGYHYCPMIDLETDEEFYCAESSERKEEI